jgi:hypothetical protein
MTKLNATKSVIIIQKIDILCHAIIDIINEKKYG